MTGAELGRDGDHAARPGPLDELRDGSRPRFELRLPLRETGQVVPDHRRVQGVGAGQRLGGIRVLVAEDNDTNRLVIVRTATDDWDGVCGKSPGGQPCLDALEMALNCP